jgi:hypothetical protein
VADNQAAAVTDRAAKAATATVSTAPDLPSILKKADVDQVLVALKAEWDLKKLGKLAAALDNYVEGQKAGTSTEVQPSKH